MNSGRFDFEDLAVFQRALDLVADTDGFVRHCGGIRKRLGFNMVDAAASVVFNIAESRGRTTTADRAHFLDMANGSAHEVGGGICIAERLQLGSEDERARLRSVTAEVIAMLRGMTLRLRRRG